MDLLLLPRLLLIDCECVSLLIPHTWPAIWYFNGTVLVCINRHLCSLTYSALLEWILVWQKFLNTVTGRERENATKNGPFKYYSIVYRDGIKWFRWETGRIRWGELHIRWSSLTRCVDRIFDFVGFIGLKRNEYKGSSLFWFIFHGGFHSHWFYFIVFFSSEGDDF